MEEINELKKQYLNGEWKLFIKNVRISNLRGWTGQKVEFKFPISVIVGENGIGKSTFLRAAACAYENKAGDTFYPSNLFIKTQWDQSSIDGALIEYEVLQGDELYPLKWKKTHDWGFTPRAKRAGKSKKPERNVYFLDISRTLPLDATAGYAKIAKQSNSEGSAQIELNAESLKWLSYVLGNQYDSARFTNTNILASREIGLLKRDFGEVSQFHQGAGEDTVLDMFKLFQTIPNQSLLIIDEVEASLHPLAQRRLIEYLIHLCRIKKIQIILSTHSPFVFGSLPEQARIMLMQLHGGKDIVYNVSTQFALSTVDDIQHPELYVAVEDDEAKILLIEVLKQQDEENIILPRIAINVVGSCSVVNFLYKLSRERKLPYNCIAFIDGDKKGEYPNCLSLPGDIAPEKEVILGLKNIGWNNLDLRFGVGAGSLYKILDDAILAPDHHKWTEKIGDGIKKSKDQVWGILIEEWCKQCLDVNEKSRVVQIFIDEFDRIKNVE